MSRLLTLFISLAVVLWGRSLLAGDSAAQGVLLRDGLLLTLLGLTIFAINASAPVGPKGRTKGLRSNSLGRSPDHLPARFPVSVVAVVGLVGALGGGVWLVVSLHNAVASSNLELPLFLWLAGLAVAVAAGGFSLRRSQRTADVDVPVVWSVESARLYLQRKRGLSAPKLTDPLDLKKRVVWVALLLLILVGLILRLWNLTGLPDGCMVQECDTVLGAMDLLNTWNLGNLLLAPSPAHTALTALFLGVFGMGQHSTLLMGLLLGTLAIPLFFAATSRFVRPATALLGTLIAVFSPLLIASSRHPGPGLLLLVLILALLASRPDDVREDDGVEENVAAGHWLRWSILAGLTLLAAPAPLTWLLFLWFVVTPPAGRSIWVVYFSSLIVAMLPRLAIGLSQGLPAALGSGDLGSNPFSRFLFQVAEQAAQFLMNGGLPALLAVLGGAYLLRHIRWRRGWVWSMGFLLAGLPLLATVHPPDLHLLAPLLALLGVGAVVAVDHFVGEFARVWSLVIRPPIIVAGMGALLAVLLAWGGVARLNDLSEQASREANGGYAAIGSYLYSRYETSVDSGGSDRTMILVPPSILSNPATQLAARGVLPGAAHIVPLDNVSHLPFTGPPFIKQGMGDLLYILPNTDRLLYRYVLELYPGMEAEPILDRWGMSWAVAYPVSRAAAANAQGMSALYVPGGRDGDNPGDAGVAAQETVEERREGPLEFQWGVTPPISPPFTMTGQGALYIPEGGIYSMRFVSDSPVRARLELGDTLFPFLVLDTESGVIEQTVDLPQGFLALSLLIETVVAESGSIQGSLSVQWQRPDSSWETIPRPALYNGPLALGNGWRALYYGRIEDADSPTQPFDSLADAPLIGWRIEPWLSGSGLLASSGLVVWQTKLAAPVEGTYAFVVDADGPYQLEIDGIELLDAIAGEPSTTSLLLSQGWHDLVLRYRPTGTEGVELRWMPPGAGTAGSVPLDVLAALPPDAPTVDLALPSPLVLDAQDAPAEEGGSKESQAVLLSPVGQRSTLVELPTDLPNLPFSLEWQVGSCGADIEQFQQPRGVVINLYNELVYIADQGNRRVILRDLTDGGLVDFYTDEAFEEPFDLAANLLGDIFVLDAVSQTIYQFEEPQGIAISQPSDTAFYRPRGMGMDLNGNFYVADTGGGRVVKLSGIDGAVALQIGGPDSALGQGQPVDVMVLPTGAIYAVTAQDGTLWRLDTGESWLAVGPSNTFDSPHFAELTTSAFFLTDPERRLVTYYDMQGTPLGQLRSDLFDKPVGAAALILDGDVLLAVADSASCQLSLWRAQLDALPE